MTVLANTDSYKMSHKGFMNEGTTFIYSNLTARSSKYFTAKNKDYKNDVVVFGLQAFIKDYLIEEWNREFFNKPKGQVISRFKRLTDSYLGTDSVSMEHFEKLHDLGYLPISIKSLPEGSRVPIKVPVLTISNTHEDFAWLTNYLETVLSCELWKPMTTATIIAEYRKAVNKYAVETTGSIEGTEFQLHGFEFRGMSGRKDAAINGAAFLLSSCGTDCVPALEVIEDYYGSDITQEFIATSVPASEHSIACLGSSVEGELESYRKWITQDYPTGIVSLVSDTYDYFKVLTDYLPELREDIMARPVNELGLSKVVIRPDCYSDDTSVYTNKGWKLFSELDDSDLVAQVLDDGTYEYVKPLKYVEQQYEGKMCHFKDYHGKVDLLVTPNHRMILEQSGEERVVFAEDLSKKGNCKQKMTRAARAPSSDKRLSELERLMIAFQADGSFSTKGNKISFTFSKKRKIDRLTRILEALGVKYKIYNLSDGRSYFSIDVQGETLLKDFSWVDTSNLTHEWCAEFVEELTYWDSHRRSDKRFKFDTTNKDVIEVVEHVAMGAGYGVLITESADNRKEHFSNVHTAHILTTPQVGGQSWTKEDVDYNGKVYCVQVPSGRLIVKRNRGTMVCGNSGNPVDIICGTADVIDLGSESRENAIAILQEMVYERVTGETDHGECGSIEEEVLFTNDGITYRATFDLFWNRYDKQYYYLEEVTLMSLEETTLTPEERGSIEILWDIFGGTTTEQGYKVLDSHIGLIYGDSITYQRATQIMERLKAKGFASTNAVFGIGSYTMNMLTRDTLGMAVKATYAEVDGEGYDLFKDPVTDDGTKKSAKGLLRVEKNGDSMILLDQQSVEQEEGGLLQEVFRDGELKIETTFTEIRERLWS